MSDVKFLPALSIEVGAVDVNNLPATLGPHPSADSLSVTLASDEAPIAITTSAPLEVDVVSSVLPTGAATEAKQDDEIALLTTIDASLAGTLTVTVDNFPATQPVSGTVDVGNFPATQAISAAALPLPTGASTEAKQDDEIALLTTIDAALADVSTATKQDDQTALLTTIDAELDAQTALLTTIDADTGTIATAAASLDTKAVQEALNYGAATGALRVAAQIGNASAIADFNAGTTSAQTLRNVPASDAPHLLNTRHEAVATPLSVRLGDGTDFITSTALAAAQKTLSTATKMLVGADVMLGWDGTTHREIAVDTSGAIQTVAGSPASSTYNEVDSLAFGSVTNTYTSVLALASAARILYIFNSLNAPIAVSLDGGATDAFYLDAQESITADYGASNMELPASADVQVKYTVGAPSSGSIRVSVIGV